MAPSSQSLEPPQNSGRFSPATVPLLDLPQPHRAQKSEILGAWAALLRKAAFIGGSTVRAFEESLNEYVTTDQTGGVANGTDAIMLALKGLGIEDVDEVITAGNNFFRNS